MKTEEIQHFLELLCRYMKYNTAFQILILSTTVSRIFQLIWSLWSGKYSQEVCMREKLKRNISLHMKFNTQLAIFT